MLNVVHWSLPLNCELPYIHCIVKMLLARITVSVNIFDYLSTPVIFGILGLEILYFDRYAALTAPELAAAISKVRK